MLGVQHEVFRHPGALTSIEQAARERDQRPEQVVRSILFRLEAGRYVLVLTAGTGQISWRKLRKHLAQTRLTLASPSEVLDVTGYPIGAVSPFGLRQRLQVLVDRRVLLEAQISVGRQHGNHIAERRPAPIVAERTGGRPVLNP